MIKTNSTEYSTQKCSAIITSTKVFNKVKKLNEKKLYMPFLRTFLR